MKIIVPKKILKRAVIAGIIILPLLILIFPDWFPGIRYPIKDFEIDLLNSVDKPDIEDREPGVEYPEGFRIEFYHITLQASLPSSLLKLSIQQSAGKRCISGTLFGNGKGGPGSSLRTF
jgi:hypothetical protein